MDNENIELITGEPKKAIIKLSIPIWITLIISFTYNLVDTVWVAGLGPGALSAIAFVGPIYMILVSIGTGNQEEQNEQEKQSTTNKNS